MLMQCVYYFSFLWVGEPTLAEGIFNLIAVVGEPCLAED